MTRAAKQRRSPRKRAALPRPPRTVEWYSKDKGAECLALLDKDGRIIAQIKIMDAPGLAEAIVAAVITTPTD